MVVMLVLAGSFLKLNSNPRVLAGKLLGTFTYLTSRYGGCTMDRN